MSPLFDLEKLTKFADDNFAVRWAKTIEELKTKMEISLDIIMNWMRASGLKVHEDKTELCLFYRTKPPSLTLQIGNQMVSTSPFMNVLGVLFDATMKWTYQVESTLKKANSAKFAIKMISKFFNKNELNDIITACYYLVLYYNADIWLMPSLSPALKQK